MMFVETDIVVSLTHRWLIAKLDWIILIDEFLVVSSQSVLFLLAFDRCIRQCADSQHFRLIDEFKREINWNALLDLSL